MAGEGADDLDAFFEEVSEVEATAKEEGDGNADNDLEPPPRKKHKVEPPPVVIPRGVVVAAAASSSKVSKPEPGPGDPVQSERTSFNHRASHYAGSMPPPPPPPPPPPLPPPLPPGPPTQSALGGTGTSIAGGDPHSLNDWPTTGLRLFVGNLASEVNENDLLQHFSAKYPSCQRSHVARDHKNNLASKGYGFVWFADPMDGARAKREMDQTWLQSRPIRIKKYVNSSSSAAAHLPAGKGRKNPLIKAQSGRRNRR
jgi:RNA recognition motif. (a.k.a. RRM, RBD, or RNP domain)